MNALRKGLLLGAVQIALVTSLGAKLSWDRHRFPRAWAKAGTWDPDLPIRGRYLGLQLEVVCDNAAAVPTPAPLQVPVQPPQRFIPPTYLRGKLRVENGRLASDCAAPNETTDAEAVPMLRQQRRSQSVVTTMLSEAVLFFLPEHASDPWQMAKGGELWAEVTLPKSGPPRPIRLAVKRGDQFTPLESK
jgi:hypothetical protein